MQYDYLITATGANDRDGVINAVMKYSHMENVCIRSHISFDGFLQTLPEAPVPGLAVACSDWLQSWGKGGGDISTERLGKSACNTDNPRRLAQEIYTSIAGRSLIAFEASSLVMTMISEVIKEIQNK